MDKDRIENAIRHIQTATDIDPWAMEIAVDAMLRMLNADGDLISRKAFMSHIENEYRKWGSDYDIEQVLGDLEDFPGAQPEQRWIPCSERLPEYRETTCYGEPCLTSEPVLVCYRKSKWYHNRHAVGEYIGRWEVMDDYAPEEDPIAWMPLPEPLEGE